MAREITAHQLLEWIERESKYEYDYSRSLNLTMAALIVKDAIKKLKSHDPD